MPDSMGGELATISEWLDLYRDNHTIRAIERVKAEGHRALARPSGIAKVRAGDLLLLTTFADRLLAAPSDPEGTEGE